MSEDIVARCGAIEECYEYLLAYDAQGLSGEGPSQSGGQLRVFLSRAVDALTGMAEAYAGVVKEEGLQPAERYDGFLAVLKRDAQDTLAIVELVLSQPVLSSQLIDNLNASIHFRALLTDLFLIDELLKLHRLAANPAAAN